MALIALLMLDYKCTPCRVHGQEDNDKNLFFKQFLAAKVDVIVVIGVLLPDNRQMNRGSKNDKPPLVYFGDVEKAGSLPLNCIFGVRMALCH